MQNRTIPKRITIHHLQDSWSDDYIKEVMSNSSSKASFSLATPKKPNHGTLVIQFAATFAMVTKVSLSKYNREKNNGESWLTLKNR